MTLDCLWLPSSYNSGPHVRGRSHKLQKCFSTHLFESSAVGKEFILILQGSLAISVYTLLPGITTK